LTSRLAAFVETQGRALVVVFLSLTAAGALFLFRLPISLFPQTDFPRIVILVDNGITPIDVQMLTVTRPIEEAVRLVPGITTVRSVTGRGATEISVFFRWDVDIQNALHLVQGRMAQIMPTLPPEARFYVNRLTFSVFPMIGFSVTSPSQSLAELSDRVYYDIAPRLYRIDGVSEVRIVGRRSPEFHVVLDPHKLDAYGLPLTQVSEAIRKANRIEPGGMVQENFRLYLTTVDGLLRDRRQIEDTVVAVVAGTPVLVRDVATVETGEQPAYNIVTADGRPAVLINVLQQPDGNAVTIADAVHREMEDVRGSLPPDVHLGTFYDQSVLVRQSIQGVAESILIGLGLSVLVLMLFLKSWRSTLVAAIVIPIATLMAIVLMSLFHMSFNLMTLGGLAASIGVVIDDAIVMVENILLHLSLGQPPRQAARSAIEELTPALIGSTLTPMVVFVPLVFLGGITAVFFRALALALVAALMASLFLAVLFTPVMARLLLRRGGAVETELEAAEQAGEGPLLRWLTNRYETALRWALGHTGAVLAAGAVILAATGALYLNLGSGFLPELDEGAFVLDYIMPPGTSLKETDRVLKHIEGLLQETPEVESYSRRTGARLALAIAEPNTGDFLVKLKDDRSRGLSEVTDELRREIHREEPVIEVEFPHILEDLIGDLAWSPEPIEIKVYHDDEATHRDAAARIAEWLPGIGGVVDVTDRTVVVGPAVNFRVDPQMAGRAGLSVPDVAAAQAVMLDGELASTMIRGGRLMGIRVRYPEALRSSFDTLRSMLVTSAGGTRLPLSSITAIDREEGQTEIHRENLRSLSSVTAQLAGRDLGSAMAEIRERLPNEVALPAGAEVEFGGLYQVQREAFLGLAQVLLMSLLLIFVILVFEFQSFAHPIAILLATVLCTSGSLLALYVTGSTLNVSSFMGIIMVIGIVHKNGILMLDSEKHFSAQGLPLEEAIFHAGRRRLRPILMTALATICGMAPLAVNVGAGAQLLQPLAISVVGGVAVSLVLSLLVTPVVFCRLRQRLAS
jgi:CzcA family heavy metal efflux pump